jgi:putative holliday junction resolvase
MISSGLANAIIQPMGVLVHSSVTRMQLQIQPMNTPVHLPKTGRLAGIDYGSVRIGIATSDPSQQFVNPYETYQRRSEKLDAQYFQRLALDERLVGWVIGLPIHCDGNESQKSMEVRQFACWLSELTGLPHVFQDERFSSKEARQLMWDTGWSPTKKKKNVDRLAAHLILTHFLQSQSTDSASNHSFSPIDNG